LNDTNFDFDDMIKQLQTPSSSSTSSSAAAATAALKKREQ